MPRKTNQQNNSSKKHFCFISEVIEQELLKGYIRADVCGDLPAEYEDEEGNYYCVLHFPEGNKGLTTNFETILRERLDTGRKNFQYTYFPNTGVFGGRTFKNDFNFSWTIFDGEANFQKAIFNGKVNFVNSYFSENVNFGSAEFLHEVDFENATFDGKTNFNLVNFHKATSFKYSTFESFVEFESSIFKELASFKGVDFNGQAFFRQTRFEGIVDFTVSKNQGHIDFHSASFFMNVDFSEIDCKEDSYLAFQMTSFHDFVNFYSARLNGVVHFEGGFKKRDLDGKNSNEFVKVFEKDRSNLDLRNILVKEPKKIIFHTLRLQPHWFINLPSNQFVYTDCSWEYDNGKKISITTEINILRKRDFPNPNALLTKAFWQLADNYEESKGFDEAVFFRKMANESKRLQSKRGWKIWSLHWWYWLTSFYGDSWQRAFLILTILILLIFPIIYTQTNFQTCSKDRPIAASLTICESKDEEIRKNCTCTTDQISFTDAIVQSLTTATLQNVEYRKPLTGWGELWIILEKIFAPLQAALLALAIRRKFMR